MKKNITVITCIFLLLAAPLAATETTPASNLFLQWRQLPSLPPTAGRQDPLGVAGPYVGVHNDALIVAGGANFPRPIWETQKVWHDDIWILIKNQETDPPTESAYTWIQGFSLDRPLAYGASVSTPDGVVCLGGNDARQTYAQVFLLQWDPSTKQIRRRYWPGLPEKCAYGAATRINRTIYLAGGCSNSPLHTALKNFWTLDLTKQPRYDEMNPKELIRLLRKRRLLAENNRSEQSATDTPSKGPAPEEMIEMLIDSDRAAARWSDMSEPQLREEAQKRALPLPETPDREHLLRELMCLHWGEFRWRKWQPWPGPSRAFNITVAQHNGQADCVYVISGRRQDPPTGNSSAPIQFLTDVYEFNPSLYHPTEDDPAAEHVATGKNPKSPWRRCADLPYCVMAGVGIDVGQSHIFILGGADGSLFDQADILKDNHPGFPRRALAYHTITDTWFPAGDIPANHVTTRAEKWQGAFIIPSGEVRPRVRSPRLWQITPVQSKTSFGAVNFITLSLYLLTMLGIGLYFSSRNKNTDDFFRGGKRIPWFVAGMSIFATMLSSITFIAIPAKAYATNWTFFLVNMTAIAIAPLVVYVFLPFFHRIDATSAYEYLEKRFNVVVRLFASASFVLFQIGRMAIVMYLPALALSAITPLSDIQCILIMGVLSIIYCTMGGITAVVWTDTIQTFILLGGAFLSLILIISRVPGGLDGLLTQAWNDDKLRLVEWNWRDISFATTALWVVVIGGIGQNLIPYTSDQAIVQRYMTVPNVSKARKAVWTNAVAVLPASILFFGMGTALYVFYKIYPARLDPTFKTDAVFPLFITRELPIGIAGLVVAGIFAAAQSTISTSMNSTATALVTDFVRRFDLLRSERAYLWLARFLTVLLGGLGTGFALLFAYSDIKSLWDQFMTVLGLFGGAMCGLFCLGIFTRRAAGPGALVGAFCGAGGLYLIQKYTSIHFLLYAPLGILMCFLAGYGASLFLPGKKMSLEGLTIFTLQRRGNE